MLVSTFSVTQWIINAKYNLSLSRTMSYFVRTDTDSIIIKTKIEFILQIIQTNFNTILHHSTTSAQQPTTMKYQAQNAQTLRI